MRILALFQKHYGERIVEHIKKHAPQEWAIEAISLPLVLPVIVDEPEEFLPPNIPQATLLLALSVSPEAAQLIPAVAKLSGAKAVIMPIDNSAWLPLGLKNQLQQELAGMGVTAVFPNTFCTLTENSTGFGDDVEPYDNEYIASFTRYFGRPKLEIKVDTQSGTIAEVKVERCAPCGSTHRVAEKLVGVRVEEAVPQAGLHAHHYPCLASMKMEPMGDTLMHIAGFVVNEEVERKLKPLRKMTS